MFKVWKHARNEGLHVDKSFPTFFQACKHAVKESDEHRGWMYAISEDLGNFIAYFLNGRQTRMPTTLHLMSNTGLELYKTFDDNPDVIVRFQFEYNAVTITAPDGDEICRIVYNIYDELTLIEGQTGGSYVF